MPQSNTCAVTCLDLGRAAYAPALAMQQRLVDETAAGAGEHLLLVEHDPPAITLGRRADAAHVLASRDELDRRGIELHQTSRGGDVTYHGPGQLVGYFISRLGTRRSLHRFQRAWEQTVIDTLAYFAVDARRRDGLTGVWVGRAKIAAIGIAAKRWVTYHGVALNICCDLEHFKLIVPCGLADTDVTSLRTLGCNASMDEVKSRFVPAFADAFGVTVTRHEAAV